MSARASNQFHDLSRFGMPTERPFGEEEVAVHGHLEDSAGARDETNFGVRELLLQLGRQTGGPRLIVSDHAKLDDHTHALLLCPGKMPRIVAVPGGAAKCNASATGDW
jgi:hypothetical protein